MSESKGRFVDQIALVTGASRGIGAGIAAALAAEGAHVIVSGRDRFRLDRVVGGILQGGGSALSVPAELTDEKDVERLRERAEQGFGPVTLLAACTGGGGEPKPLSEESVERWHKAMETNLITQFLTLRTFLPPMLQKREGGSGDDKLVGGPATIRRIGALRSGQSGSPVADAPGGHGSRAPLRACQCDCAFDDHD